MVRIYSPPHSPVDFLFFYFYFVGQKFKQHTLHGARFCQQFFPIVRHYCDVIYHLKQTIIKKETKYLEGDYTSYTYYFKRKEGKDKNKKIH